jgi:sterol desaturase/sphingolipid hydroxylase (fatty acid hydroxylase superfamily)
MILNQPSMRLTVLLVAVGFMVLEYLISRILLHDEETHDLADSASSFAVAAGRHLLHSIEAGLAAMPFALVYQHRLMDFDTFSIPAIAMLFVASEFIYYWHHRLSHNIRWMWASHAVHHSPIRLNFTAAIRLGWTGNISGNFLFYLPLAYIGYHPFEIVAILGANLLYQFFIHTELGSRLGVLESVLNTPAHHRVHHATNESCLDKNFGGVLILFDRLFGTFAETPVGESLRYGLVGVTPTYNPLRIVFGEWARLGNDFLRAPSIWAKIGVLVSTPGSSSSETNDDLASHYEGVPTTDSTSQHHLFDEVRSAVRSS